MQLRKLLKQSPLALAIAALAVATPLCAQESSDSTPQKFQQAQDMRYGAALYHYFQGNTFDALSTLMVADERGGIAHHADNADLIRGGISLAFGLEKQAAELFEKQLGKATSGDQQQRLQRYREIAWLKLAELNYRHRNWDIAAQQLAKSGALQTSTMPIHLAIQLGDLQRAEQLLTLADLPVAERALAHINLGAALARTQQLREAAEQYRRAAGLVETSAALMEENPDTDRELRILRDKARIGAGYALALDGDFAAAATEFRSVRLDTAWSADALLGLGWAAVNSGSHQLAVDALGYLIQQNPLSPQVQEALLALPYSYEQLQRPKLALQAYQHAEQQYQQALSELSALSNATAQLELRPSAPPAAEGASTEIDLQRYGWLQDAETPALVRDNQRYLLQMMQSDRLQLQLAELRDLQQLQRVLVRWRQRLPEFRTLIDERAQRRIDIVQQYQSAQYDQQVQIAEAQLRQLQESLADIEQRQDGLAMLSGEAGDYLEMLRDAEQRYALLSKAGKTRNYQRETLARARGLLIWEGAEQYHENLWHKRKAVTELEQQLQQADKLERSVERIAARAPQLNQLTERVLAARQRLSGQEQAIENASAAIETQIRNDLQEALVTARQRVEQYMAHTRLAIARIQDASMQSQWQVDPAPADNDTESESASTSETESAAGDDPSLSGEPVSAADTGEAS